MNNFIATTSINPPTEALKKFAAKDDWTLIVAGDLNTPEHSYERELKNCIYLSPKDQKKKYKKLSDLISWNCIQRRTFAILEAYEFGADIIAVVDDDNVPYSFWGETDYLNWWIMQEYTTHLPVADPFYLTNQQGLWHRGFPLQYIRSRPLEKTKKVQKQFDIQADFWNGSPDVDAISRLLVSPEPVYFNDTPFPFCFNVMSPFNSQNTLLKRNVIKDYFLFPGVGRMDDIWASYYVESKGHSVCYTKASVFHQRNDHNLMKDFQDEFLGYTQNHLLIDDLLKDSENIYKYLPTNSAKAFDEYRTIMEKL